MYKNIRAAVMGSINMDIILNMKKVPEVGDKFTFETLNVEVTETDERRASLITVTVTEEVKETEE